MKKRQVFMFKSTKYENGGSMTKLSVERTKALEKHLKTHVYVKVAEICEYVLKAYGIFYSRQGMTDWLHVQGFSYKTT